METDFSAEDFQPLESFGLIWRWTQETHNVLPQEVLVDIQSLTEAKAKEMWLKAKELHRQLDVLSCLSNKELAASKAACRSASYDDSEGVRAWLRARPVGGDTAIIVFWRFSGDALITRWQIFCEYWDDFCYPSSDDVIIWPLSGQWAAEYQHFEEFCFAERMEFA